MNSINAGRTVSAICQEGAGQWPVVSQEIATLALGSFGPLCYLLTRKAAAPPR